MNKNIKIGLALGCGTARGFAHIGVLKVLEKEKIKINYLAGSSMGAIIAGIYSWCESASVLEQMARDFGFGKFARVANPSFSKSGIFDGKNIEKILKGFIGDITFADLKIPVSVVSTDICTGEEVIFTEGLLRKALRATVSLPGMFVPMPYKNTYLVDGGLANPIPANVVRKMGADVIIAVDVNRNVKKYTEFMRRKKEKPTADHNETFIQSLSSFFENWYRNASLLNIFPFRSKRPWTPNMIDVLLQTVYIAEEKIAISQLHDTPIDIILSPDMGHITMWDFNKAEDIIKLGEEAAYTAIDKIRSAVNSFAYSESS